MQITKTGKAIIVSSVAGLIIFCLVYILSFKVSILIWGPVEPPFMAIVEISVAGVLAIIAGLWVLFIFERKSGKLSAKPKKAKK